MRESFDFLGRKTWGGARAPQPLPKQRLCCGRLIEVTEQKRFYLHWQLAVEYTQWPGVLTFYMEKPEVPVGKWKWFASFFWKALENIDCDLRRCNFSILFSLLC